MTNGFRTLNKGQVLAYQFVSFIPEHAAGVLVNIYDPAVKVVNNQCIVHKDTLCSLSEYFYQACADNFQNQGDPVTVKTGSCRLASVLWSTSWIYILSGTWYPCPY